MKNREEKQIQDNINNELSKKSFLIINPETLTEWQRNTILSMKYSEDIYLIGQDDGKWKVWKRIFN
jgi:hypothetical protein